MGFRAILKFRNFSGCNDPSKSNCWEVFELPERLHNYRSSAKIGLQSSFGTRAMDLLFWRLTFEQLTVQTSSS